jgi:UDPglucose 6-dehydrogenase
VKALVCTGDDMGIDRRVLTAGAHCVETANDTQKRVLVEKVVARFGDDLQGRPFALWGLAFKPDTDDTREAPSRVIVHELLHRGAAIQAYDPVATAATFSTRPGPQPRARVLRHRARRDASRGGAGRVEGGCRGWAVRAFN